MAIVIFITCFSLLVNKVTLNIFHDVGRVYNKFIIITVTWSDREMPDHVSLTDENKTNASVNIRLVFSGWQFLMLPSRAINIYIIYIFCLAPIHKSCFNQIGDIYLFRLNGEKVYFVSKRLNTLKMKIFLQWYV